MKQFAYKLVNVRGQRRIAEYVPGASNIGYGFVQYVGGIFDNEDDARAFAEAQGFVLED